MNKYNVPKKEYENVKQEMNSFSGGGDSDSSDVEYFKIDWNTANSNFKYLLTIGDGDSYGIHWSYVCSRRKVVSNGMVMIECNQSYHHPIAFSYEPVAIPKEIMNSIVQTDKDIYSFVEVIELINRLSEGIEYEPFDLSMEGLTPITKEEFYDLNNI